MRENTVDNTGRQKNKINVMILMLILMIILPVAAGGMYSFAKYYAKGHKYAVAIASGIYFTSNYAAKFEGDYFESIANLRQKENTYNFDFEVRNYENNLLFNESGTIIDYSVSFWLDDSSYDSLPEGIEYSVTYDEQSMPIGIGQSQAAVYQEHSIAGGRAIANKYRVTMTVDSNIEKPEFIPLYVKVKTKEGAVINSTLACKLILNTSKQSDSYIEFQGFVFAEDFETDEDRLNAVKSSSGLSYEIRTVGETVINGKATELLKVSWNPKILDVDLFDELYIKWQEEIKTEYPDKYADTQPVPLDDPDRTGWKYITIKVMPYSSNVLYFFKEDEFDTISSYEELQGSIIAEKYQQSDEVSQ